MNILIEIDHPAHVHFFKHAIPLWQARGHKTLVAARDKDVTKDLLQESGIPFVTGSVRHANFSTEIKNLFVHVSRLVRMSRHFNADVFLSVGSTYAAWAAALAGRPHIAFDDTEHARLEHMLYRPCSKIVCTPSCYQGNFGKKQYRYQGYHELAYLHPSRYSPNAAILEEMGLSATDVYSVVRFVSWEAVHDRGLRGFSEEGKRRLVHKLSRIGRIVITSESPLAPEMEPFRLPVSPGKMHDVLYHSSLYIGEGATMASEAAMLGVPCIYVNPLSAGTLNEQEHRYGLLRQIVNEKEAIDMAILMASDREARIRQQERRGRMLADKIDVTAWMVDFVERFPESVYS